MKITLRIKTEDEHLIHDLVAAWLDNQPVTIHTATVTAPVELTYVKES